jgi:abortive infection bacteriophage resistance protein
MNEFINKKIRLLEDKGLIINDLNKIEIFLNNINYYQLREYFYFFEENNKNFKKNVNFEDVLNIYFFDRELRLLFLDLIERIEKSFKAQVFNYLFFKYGENYFIENIYKENQFSDIKINKTLIYNLVDFITFGEVLEIFKNLKKIDKINISKFYNIDYIFLHSYLNNLREVRNICAHFSRLWNRKITKILRKSDFIEGLTYNKYIFDSILLSNIFLKNINPEYEWTYKIINLIKKYDINVNKMGFPYNWKDFFK